jgi:hypothetical protein
MATTNTVTSGLSTIAPEIAPYYKGVGTPGSADYVQGLLPKAQELYSKDYATTIGNALDTSGLGGAGRIAQMGSMEQGVGNQLNAMQTPSQFNAGSNLANTAGAGQLNTVGQASGYGGMGAGYGQMGVNYGQQASGLAGLGLGIGGQAAGAGQNYMSMATNPGAQQAFMSPYLQNALDPQLAEMRRQYGISGAQQQGNATRAGAFGGNREALMNAENSRNMGTAMNQAIGQGYQNAFNAANQNMQYGSTLGLQGLQTGLQGLSSANQAYQTGLQGTAQGMQGAQIGLQGVGAQQAGYAGANQAAGTLGQLGTQQQASDLARLQAMSAQGSSERAIAQQVKDTQYQDLMNKQYFGQQQLGGMQGVLTGVPVNQSASTSSVTAPAPSMASQLAGGATSLLGLYSLYNK